MSKVKLAGLDIAVYNFGKTIKIQKEDSGDKNSKNIQINIIDAQGNIVNGMTCENLVHGLIVCSNYYLPTSMQPDDNKNYKCKLEKMIKKGVVVNIKKFQNDGIHLAINLQGKDKYNFYGKNIIELINQAEELKKIINQSL